MGAAKSSFERRTDSVATKLFAIAAAGAIAAGLLAVRDRLTAPAPAHADRLPRVLTDPLAKERVAIDARNPPPPSAGGATSADRRALLDAASRGDTSAVEALFARGVALDGTLENAASSGSAPLVRWLLEHGVPATDGEALSVPPLLLADEHQDVVDLLLARGAHDVSLDKAVLAGAPNAVRRAIAKGASPRSAARDADPLLVVAVRNASGAKRKAIVDALAAAHAPLDARTEEGDSALSLLVAEAIRARDEEGKKGERAVDLVASLVAKGAKVTGALLASVAKAPETDRAAVLDVLLGGTLERDATLEAASAAAEAGDVALVRKLATRGIAWSALDKNATTPLERAIVDGEPLVVRALLEAGAPTGSIGQSSNPALLTAVTAASGESDASVAIVRLLLERGASPNVRGLEGRTPLFAAAQQGSERLVTMLVARGARVDDEVDGMTPLEGAELAGHDGVATLLRARGARAKKR